MKKEIKNTGTKTETKCVNCGARPKAAWLEAMYRAGFGLRQIACKKCDQNTLAEHPKKGGKQ
jgi:hypothetical protein